MEIDLEVAGHPFSVSASTSIINPALAIAVVAFENGVPHLNQNEQALYRAVKTAALAELAQYLGVAPLVIEPEFPPGQLGAWQRRRQRASAAATTLQST